MKVPVILVALIAVGSLIQILFVAAVAWKGLALARGLGDLKKRFREEVGPALDEASRIAANASALSELASGQMRRVDASVSTAMDKLEEIRETVSYELDRVSTLAAVVRSLGRGVAAFRGRRPGPR